MLKLVFIFCALLLSGMGSFAFADGAGLSSRKIARVLAEASDAADGGDYETVNEILSSIGTAPNPQEIEAIRISAYTTALSNSIQRGIEMLDNPWETPGLIDANEVAYDLSDFVKGKWPLSDAGKRELNERFAENVKAVVDAIGAVPKGFRHEAQLQLLKLRETAEGMGASIEIPSSLRYLKHENASLVDERVMFEAIDSANTSAPKTKEIDDKLASIADVTSFQEVQDVLARAFGNTVKGLLYRGSGYFEKGELDKGLQSYREAVNFMNRNRWKGGLRGVKAMVHAFNAGNTHTLHALEQQISEGDHEKAKQVLNIVISRGANMNVPFTEMDVPDSLARYLDEPAQKALAFKRRKVEKAKLKAIPLKGRKAG